MAIAFDATGPTTAYTGGATSLTFSHTTGSGSNRILLVGFLSNGTNGGDAFTGVTYNGVAMTRLLRSQHGTDGYGCYVYGLLAPATGANDVVISASSSQVIYACSSSYTGVSQVALPSNVLGKSMDGSTWTEAITIGTVNSWAVAFCRCNNNPTATSPDTLRGTSGSPNPNYFVADSNAALSTGSYTIDGTKQESGVDVQITLEILAAAASSTAANRLALLGVG